MARIEDAHYIQLSPLERKRMNGEQFPKFVQITRAEDIAFGLAEQAVRFRRSASEGESEAEISADAYNARIKRDAVAFLVGVALPSIREEIDRFRNVEGEFFVEQD